VLMPDSLSRLRQTAVWPWVRRVQRRLGPPLCAGVHAVVVRSSPRWLPTGLVLKHRYDYQLVYIDPHTIQRSLRVGEWARPGPATRGRLGRLRRWLQIGGGWKHLRRHVTRNVHGRFIAEGDWDLRHQPFEIRETILDLFAEGRAPAETVEYQKMRSWVERGDQGWTRGCRTIEDVDEYFAELVRLHDTMRRDGYRSQQQLGNDGADEIRICIDRAGRPCIFGGGTHRLSLALLLDVPQVPVVIKRVHGEWVRACQAQYATADVHEVVARGVAELAAARGGPQHVGRMSS
jgi:hypothetical protein